jgi:hypothetical protein
MVYATGQENYTGEEGRRTPTDKYKGILMDTLKRCIELDITLKDEEFIRCVDQLHNLMRLYAIHRTKIVEEYSAKVLALNKTLKDTDDDTESGFNQEQKNRLKLEKRYQYAKEFLNLIIDMMNSSPIIEKEMEGLFFSPTSLQDYAAIRERISHLKVE